MKIIDSGKEFASGLKNKALGFKNKVFNKKDKPAEDLSLNIGDNLDSDQTDITALAAEYDTAVESGKTALKMEEIFSTTEKTVKEERQDPLEIEDEEVKIYTPKSKAKPGKKEGVAASKTGRETVSKETEETASEEIYRPDEDLLHDTAGNGRNQKTGFKVNARSQKIHSIREANIETSDVENKVDALLKDYLNQGSKSSSQKDKNSDEKLDKAEEQRRLQEQKEERRQQRQREREEEKEYKKEKKSGEKAKKEKQPENKKAAENVASVEVADKSAEEKNDAQKDSKKQKKNVPNNYINGEKIPEYISSKSQDSIDKVYTDTPKLSAVFRLEYVNYLKHKKQMEAEQARASGKGISETGEFEYDEPEIKGVFGRLFNRYRESPVDYADAIKAPSQDIDITEDYDRPEDARAVRAEIRIARSRMIIRCLLLVVIFVLTVTLETLAKNLPVEIVENIPNAPFFYCLINAVLMLAAAGLSFQSIKSGLKPLLHFSGNYDTMVSIAVIASVIQSILALFYSQSFFDGTMYLFTMVIMFILVINMIGKIWVMRRIKNNFRFVTAPGRKFVVKSFDDRETAKRMTRDTIAQERTPIIAFQRRTGFLKNFLRLSYAPDPGENVCSKLSPIITIVAIAAAIVYGFLYKNIVGAFSVLAIVAAIGVPASLLLAVNIPMTRMSSKALSNDAMIAGYPSAKRFGNTNALMLDSSELYPRGNIEVVRIKTFNAYNVEKALINAAAVMKVANNSLTYVFESIITEKRDMLPNVESIKFEDTRGLVSWVSGERVLIGSRALLIKYGVDLPTVEFEKKNRIDKENQVTYIACGTNLIAMIVTYYQPDERCASVMQKLEREGVAFVIRTADPNVTRERVAEDFGLYPDCIRILPTSLGNICKEQTTIRDERSTAYIATKGRAHSMLRAILSCIKIKGTISLAIVIQLVAVILGLVITCVVMLAAGPGSIKPEEMLIYVLVWSAASIIAPVLQKY